MSLALLLNSDAGVQAAGTVVRTGPVANSCVLALADSAEHVTGLLGTRLDDVAAGVTGTIGGFLNGMVVRLTASAAAGNEVYLSDTVPGCGVNVAPAVKVLLGVAYHTYQEGGVWYAELIMASYVPQVPVPDVNSAANAFESDVVGNKGDDQDGTSLAAQTYRNDHHIHSAARVYPTMADGAEVTKSSTPWTEGNFAVVVPAGTITSPFDLHGVNFGEIPDSGVYEVVFYAGPDGAEAEVCRTRFTRSSIFSIQFECPLQSPIIAASSQVKAKLAGSNSSATTVTLSVRYHVY